MKSDEINSRFVNIFSIFLTVNKSIVKNKTDNELIVKKKTKIQI